MATDLIRFHQPDQAVLLFKSRGDGGMPDLEPGMVFHITGQDDPTRSIVVEIATATELVARIQESPEAFHDFVGNWAPFKSRQQFSIVIDESTDPSSLALTPRLLGDVVVPIISALSSLQRILFGKELTIKSITQNSPVQISLEGAADLWEKMATDIIPWRRKRAKQIAALEAAKSYAHLEQQRAEVLAAEAKSDRGRAECEEAWERARKARMEANLKEVELTRARFELAADIVDRLLPGPMNAEKLQMISQMMPELVRLTGAVEIIAT